MFFVYILIIIVVTVVALTVLLYVEQKDKERRKAEGKPPKRYHDITDHDVYTVYTIEDKHR